MRAGVACIALGAILVTNQAVAQTAATEGESRVEAPQLPPEAPKRSPIVEIPLPAAPPAPPPPPLIEKRAPAPVVIEKPKAVPAAAPTAAPVAAPRPQTECVIKPVMSDDDLRACGALR